jgi:hypothetical protein
MRKTTLMAIAAAGVLLSTSAFAAQPYRGDYYGPVVAGTGAVVGTVAGVGTFNGWWGSSAAAALPASAAGAWAIGGLAGVGTVALIDAAVQPCDGFHALFGLNKDVCVNGQYVPGGARVIRR